MTIMITLITLCVIFSIVKLKKQKPEVKTPHTRLIEVLNKRGYKITKEEFNEITKKICNEFIEEQLLNEKDIKQSPVTKKVTIIK